MSRKHFYKSDLSDLDLYSNLLNVNRGHVSIKTNQHVNYKRSAIKSAQYNEWAPFLHFSTGDPCDLDLKSSISKIINRDHVLSKTNQHVKYESSVIQSFHFNEWKLFIFTKVTLLTLTFENMNSM